MHWQLSPYAILVSAGGIISAMLTISAWRRRPETGAAIFTLMMGGVTLWSLTNALELSATRLAAKIIFAKVEYIGIVIVPVTWLCFALQYTGRQKWITRRNLALLSIIPILTLGLAWTNETHGLLWRSTRLGTDGSFPVLVLTHGIWFWFYITFSYIALSIGTLSFIHALIHSPRLFHGQTGTLLVGLFAPWVGNFLYLSGLNPFPHLDLTLVGFVITGLALSWGLFYYRILETIPVARNVVMEQMSDGVIVLDHQNRVIDFNPAAQSFLENLRPDAIGTPITDILSNLPAMAECCHKENVEFTELALPVGNKERIFDLRVSLFRDWRGTPQGKLMIWRDITEKKGAEEAIRKSEERHRSVTQSSNDAIILMDSDWRIISWNRGAENIFGYSEEKILGQPATRLMPGHYKQLHLEEVKRLRAGGKPRVIGKTIEYTGKREGGSTFPVELSLASWEAGKKTFFSAIIRDITARKQAESIQHRYAKELEAQNAELDAFAHTVAHDLKKPLTELIGFSSLLKIQITETLNESQSNSLQKIEQNALKMGNIIDELLLLASVRDMKKIDTHPLDMAKIIAEVRMRLEYMIGEYQAELVLPECWPEAIGYRPWIEEVWVNYLSNAVQYGGRPPHIQMGATVEKETIRFWVRDNGEGLSPDDQAQLFTAFERLHQASIEGHGLGLSIVRRIVEKLGGRVGVESRKGHGSTFFFTLPCA